MGTLSAHFSHSEFMCRCGCRRHRVTSRLVAALEALRSAVGRPVVILSGVRCWEHNRRVGGSPKSRHLGSTDSGAERVADAADVACPGLSVRELYRAVEALPHFAQGGVGVYPARGFVHVDTRGTRARWAQLQRGGKYVAIPEEYLT